MRFYATKITVAFEPSLNSFSAKKTIVIGNPVRQDILPCDRNKSLEYFHLKSELPTVLVLGGGTGAQHLNHFVVQSLNMLVQKCQVIHITGKYKQDVEVTHSRYRSFEFITNDMKYAYGAADCIVSRGGMSSLSEIAYIKKPCIIIPIPDSHQEENAVYIARNNAAYVLEQKGLTPEAFSQFVLDLISDEAQMQNLRRNIGKIMVSDSAQRMADIIMGLKK